MELRVFLNYVVSGGGAGILAYVLMERVPFLARLASEPKRYVAFALSAALAMGALGLQVALGYQITPETTRAWIEGLFLVGTSAFSLSQIIHARAKLKT